MNREYEALKIRYRALSDDWNRMRDVDVQWRRLERFLYALSVVLILGALTVVSGCATAPWQHPTNSFSQTDTDIAECEYEAHKATADNGYGNPWMIGAERASLMQQCMRVRGYYQ